MLFCRLAECIDGDAVDETVDRCLDEVQRAEKPEGASGLLDEAVEDLLNDVFEIGEKPIDASRDGGRSKPQLNQTTVFWSSCATGRTP